MTDREAMKMALEALEAHADFGIKADKSIEALRQALAQPEQSKYSDIVSDGGLDPRNKFDAQPEQKPVAMVTGYKNGHCVIAPIGGNTIFQTGLALYTAPPKREWVGLTDEERRHYNNRLSGSGVAEEIEANLKEKNT